MFRVIKASSDAMTWQDAYSRFERIANSGILDEDEIELEIRQVVRENADDPAYQEAYRRWKEGADDSILEIMDTLEEDGFDLDDPQEIMMGLGADLGYDREDAQAIFHRILMYRGIQASTDIIAATRSDDKKYLCRIARYGEFDNGHVLFGGWKKMTPLEAEEAAQQASIGHPEDIYYVRYDDIMNPDTDWRYVDGERYHYSDVVYRNGQVEFK